MTDAEVKKINTDIDNSVKLTAQQIVTLDSQARKNLADAYLARVTAQIKKDTEGTAEWQAAQLENIKANTYKALVDGDARDIENALKEYHLDMLPHKGKSIGDNIGYYWAKYISFTLGPIGDVLSSALSGIGAAATR